MASIQCKMCGGKIELPDDVTTGECPYCGSVTTFPMLNTEQREHLYSRAEHFRQANNFDKAVSAYEAILNLDSEDPEAYWGLLISRYGIEYVEDPATHERVPTCHRVQFDSILADPDYLNALKYSFGYDRDIYEKEANRIAEIQKNILRVSAQEKPYDVFICYKETTDGGSRTKDSTLAQDIYYQLTNQGLKVFFSRITLEDKLGQQYEPYIFAALNSAKVMLVIGTKKEYFEAVWVKNEWSRFLALMKKDRSKLLIPCYRDMDAYDIPEELSLFQSQDMSKIGFIQDILRGIMKVVNAGKEKTKTNTGFPATSQQGYSGTENLIKRISVLMLQKEWNEANDCCKRALETDPENAELYLLLCMIGHKISTEDELLNTGCDLANDKNFQFALRFASPERGKQLEDIRIQALVNYYLIQCMQANHIASKRDLSHAQKPLVEDDCFQKALKIAPPQIKADLIQIQRDQVEYFLQQCIESCKVSSESELIRTNDPLAENSYFQKAMKVAEPERKQELQRIIYAQAEYFLQQCMIANKVTNENELSCISDLLKEDRLFLLALRFVAEERKTALQKILEDQTEHFLQQCIANHHVSQESELAQVDSPMTEDTCFQKALKCATDERKKQLHQIQINQSEYFLKQCMVENKVSEKKDLVFVSVPLNEDKNFQMALKCWPGTNDELRNIQKLQTKQKQKERRNGCVAKVVIFIGLWFIGVAIVSAIVNSSSSDSSSNKNDLALVRYLADAEKGDVHAQFKLGVSYYKGDGVEKNYVEAVKWFRKAAEQGDIVAQYNLGLCCYEGDGMERTYAEAAKWWRKAAEQGYANAQTRLGVLIYDKLDMDYSEAVHWLRKAAEQNDAEAQFYLGECYYYGTGVEQDVEEAMKWYQKAAEQDYYKAKSRIEFFDLLHSAEQGDPGAQFSLGYRYYYGTAVKEDREEAIKWYRKAAEQGNKSAQNMLEILGY